MWEDSCRGEGGFWGYFTKLLGDLIVYLFFSFVFCIFGTLQKQIKTKKKKKQ